MSLSLGKSFDRSISSRINFLEGHFNVTAFFNKRSTFLLFDVNQQGISSKNIKIKMYKNLFGSQFCELFLNLYSHRNHTLDIQNQFMGIKQDRQPYINFLFNETYVLSKMKIEEDSKKEVEDKLNLYGFFLNDYVNEFIFILAERQNIQPKLRKKIVRTTGLQIATSDALHFFESI